MTHGITRTAGLTYLLFVAAVFPSMILFEQATSGQDMAAKLARVAQYAPNMRVSIVLSALACLIALVLAVALYVITRSADADLAAVALSFGIGESLVSAIQIIAASGLLFLATAASKTGATDAPEAYAIGEMLMKAQVWSSTISATFFAVGSALFSWLLLRGRMVPVRLAWLGVIASALLIILLPAQLAGFFGARLFGLFWLPMLVFGVALALWLLIKGVAMPAMTPLAPKGARA